jgi:hypothetical protein
MILDDEKHERPMLAPDPLLTDFLPSIHDADWDSSSNDMPVSGNVYTVSSILPKEADSFARQVQCSHLMGLVRDVIHTPFEDDPVGTRTRVFQVDRLLQEALGKLLVDCDGGCTQFCGPISLCIAGCFLLHDYQLQSTMTSSDIEDIQAASRSKLTIAKMVSIMVDILRAFPLQHLPELSPSALACPYFAAHHSLQLDRLNGVKSQPTLGGSDFELLVNALKHFSNMWKCTGTIPDSQSLVLHDLVTQLTPNAGEYVKNIERSQARSLPLPLPQPISVL